jgi:hypothetical protein
MSADHHHDHDSQGEMPFDEKLVKLLDHWIKHNHDHALNYRNWAEKAKANDQPETAALLEEAADMSLATNALFKKALAGLGGN